MSLTNKEKFQLQSEVLTEKVSNLNDGELPTANIIVAGIAGTGKSTLINAVFGEDMAKTGIGRPVTDHIKDYSIPDGHIRIWDTVGIELDEKKREKAIRDIKQTIADKTSSKDKFDRIHAIWYCITSGSNRYQNVEIEFVKSLHSVGVPFIIVITQCIRGEEDDEFEKKIQEINKYNNLDDIQVVQVIAKDYKTAIGTVPASGLEDLVDVTLKSLPEFIKSGFIAAQRVDVVQKRTLSEEIIIEYITAAKNGFWDKVPIINMFTTDYAIQKMLQKIGIIYNTTLPKESIQKITNDCSVKFTNLIQALLNPFKAGYHSRVFTFLEEMHEKEGFGKNVSKLNNSENAAIMIAFYGYTFVMSIEELWNELTEEQLKNIRLVVDRLIETINKKLDEIRRKQNVRI